MFVCIVPIVCRTWKCMNKTELLQEHTSTWRKNGLIDLTYEILSERKLFAQVTFTYIHSFIHTSRSDELLLENSSINTYTYIHTYIHTYLFYVKN